MGKFALVNNWATIFNSVAMPIMLPAICVQEIMRSNQIFMICLIPTDGQIFPIVNVDSFLGTAWVHVLITGGQVKPI